MGVICRERNATGHTAREGYREVWKDIDGHQLRYPEGRLLHLSWTVGDVLHVVDVWDSPEGQEAFMGELVPILERHDASRLQERTP